MSDNIQQTIVDLLNQASIYGKDNIRVQHLRHVQELILRKDPNLLNQFLEEVLNFQTDKSIEVKKTIISFIEEACFISIYKSTLLFKSRFNDENIDNIWQRLTNIKNHIIYQLKSDNDGLCIVIIKFIEMFVIILSEHKQDFLVNDQKIQLQQEEKDMIEKLFNLTLSQHLSNINLIAIIEAITNIVRYKPNYLIRLVEIFEILQKNLPSSLIQSQIDNIHKIIKLKLFNLLKHSVSTDLQPRIINLLTNLGATQTEIAKYFSETKRKLPLNNLNKTPKKSKNMNTEKETLSADLQHQKVMDLIKKLSLQNVVDLVLVSMNLLPEKIPESFQSIYTPVVDAGSATQIEHLARLLSTQLTSTTDNKSSSKLINQSKKTKSYKFSNAIKPIEYNEMQRMSIDSFYRILHAEDICEKAGVSHIHKKIINSLVYLSEQSFSDIYKDYIITDIHQRYDLAFTWLYSEYIHTNGYLGNKKKDFTKYDNILCQLLEYLQEKDNHFFSCLLTSVPLITDNALFILKRYCLDEEKNDCGMNILYKLIIYRIPIQEKCLDILINLTQNENNFIRHNAIDLTKNLYTKKINLKQLIERYALKVLQMSEVISNVSKENSIHLCLSLYRNLTPLNHCLIQPLINLYTTVNEDIKQTILQILENPIREMDMNSPDILKLIKTCPKGSETLIIHIIHILTEQMPPSCELIENIRDLYYKHISDIRFLIPILTHLEKREILSELPKLIKLSPSIVKEVFNQLLGLNNSPKISHISSISPSELLIALHQISIEECELKTIINATSLCFNEHSIYTDKILAEIIQQLIEITPIPLLFMRTVLQTLNLYPKLIHFIMNILQQLIKKQIWKQARIWEGFIKCCEKTQPYSFPLLLQLPSSQLKHVFQIASGLHDSLRRHLRSISTDQYSSIPLSILTVIEDNSELSL